MPVPVQNDWLVRSGTGGRPFTTLTVEVNGPPGGDHPAAIETLDFIN